MRGGKVAVKKKKTNKKKKKKTRATREKKKESASVLRGSGEARLGALPTVSSIARVIRARSSCRVWRGKNARTYVEKRSRYLFLIHTYIRARVDSDKILSRGELRNRMSDVCVCVLWLLLWTKWSV